MTLYELPGFLDDDRILVDPASLPEPRRFLDHDLRVAEYYPRLVLVARSRVNLCARLLVRAEELESDPRADGRLAFLRGPRYTRSDIAAVRPAGAFRIAAGTISCDCQPASSSGRPAHFAFCVNQVAAEKKLGAIGRERRTGVCELLSASDLTLDVKLPLSPPNPTSPYPSNPSSSSSYRGLRVDSRSRGWTHAEFDQDRAHLIKSVSLDREVRRQHRISAKAP